MINQNEQAITHLRDKHPFGATPFKRHIVLARYHPHSDWVVVSTTEDIDEALAQQWAAQSDAGTCEVIVVTYQAHRHLGRALPWPASGEANDRATADELERGIKAGEIEGAPEELAELIQTLRGTNGRFGKPRQTGHGARTGKTEALQQEHCNSCCSEKIKEK